MRLFCLVGLHRFAFRYRERIKMTSHFKRCDQCERCGEVRISDEML